MAGRSFEDLEVWRRAMTLATDVIERAERWRKPVLHDQLVRAVISVPSNIAEGAERLSALEFRQFLGYAKGSLGETRTQLLLAGRLGLEPQEWIDSTVGECRELGRMVWGLVKSLGD